MNKPQSFLLAKLGPSVYIGLVLPGLTWPCRLHEMALGQPPSTLPCFGLAASTLSWGGLVHSPHLCFFSSQLDCEPWAVRSDIYINQYIHKHMGHWVYGIYTTKILNFSIWWIDLSGFQPQRGFSNLWLFPRRFRAIQEAKWGWGSSAIENEEHLSLCYKNSLMWVLKITMP